MNEKGSDMGAPSQQDDLGVRKHMHEGKMRYL